MSRRWAGLLIAWVGLVGCDAVPVIANLPPGRYEVTATLVEGDREIGTTTFDSIAGFTTDLVVRPAAATE